jgi:D-alanine transaminase
MHVYLNGEFLPQQEARISVLDRGFLFGDGIYEVTRALHGRLIDEELHWRRFEAGARELRLGFPPGFTRESLRGILERLLRDNGHAQGDASVYVQLTRGAAPRAHAFPATETPPTLYAYSAPFQVPWEQRLRGVDVITHPDLRWARCDIKTVNLLPNVLAKQRAKEAGAFEALLVRDGHLTEGSASSVFGVVGGELLTYPRGPQILPGVTRAVVLELARELDLRVREAPLRLAERERWQELLLTGTTSDVQPIISVDGTPVGEGRPGPVCRALQAALYRRMGLPVDAVLAPALPASSR